MGNKQHLPHRFNEPSPQNYYQNRHSIGFGMLAGAQWQTARAVRRTTPQLWEQSIGRETGRACRRTLGGNGKSDPTRDAYFAAGRRSFRWQNYYSYRNEPIGSIAALGKIAKGTPGQDTKGCSNNLLLLELSSRAHSPPSSGYYRSQLVKITCPVASVPFVTPQDPLA